MSGPKGRRSRLSPRQVMEILASILFFTLGVVILGRTILETGLLLGLGVGGAFLAYGAFRLYHLWKFLAGGRRRT